MSLLKDTFYQNNKNKNGKRRKKFAKKFLMRTYNKLEKWVNGNRFNSKIIFNKIKPPPKIRMIPMQMKENRL